MEEQIENIAQAQAEEQQATQQQLTVSTDQVPDAVIGRALTSGGNDEHSIEHIVAFFQRERTGSAAASFMEKEFGEGGKGVNIAGQDYALWFSKLLSFRAPGQERFTRSHKLGAEYTKEALRERSSIRRGSSTGRKVNMLIDIQAKMAAGKGAGYERWAKIFNLKEAAKTLNFLIENGLTDYDELAARAAQASDRFNDVSRRIKQLEARMAEVAQLKTHIINYSKTREVYAAYKKSRHKKEFLAEHGAEIAQHEAAKKAFDALGGKPIPKVASYPRTMPLCWLRSKNSMPSIRHSGRT